MKKRALKFTEWSVAILLTLTVLALLVVRVKHAGGLWRDECASVQVAVMPTIGELFTNFQRESFPAFFYLLLRSFTFIFGTSDVAFRALGFAVGVMLLAVLWMNSRILNGEPPLMSLALLGLNTTFLIWGTTIRGYGIGSVLILLTLGLIARILLNSTNFGILAALAAALAGVQVLLYNSVLLPAITTAALFVCLYRGKTKLALVMGAITLVCGVSMLPYVGPFWNESRSTIVLQGPLELGFVWSQLRVALGNPPPLTTTLWSVGFFLAIGAGATRVWLLRSSKPFPEWDLLLFGLLVPPISLGCFLIFVEIMKYGTREWYFLALLAVLAGTIDLIVATLSRANWVRVIRLGIAGIALIVLPIFDWAEVIKRQTNIDLIVNKLRETARPNDLIIVNPWYYGVAFNWYYQGPTRWISVPPMDDHRVHRFDLLKAKMMSSNAIDDLYPMMRSILSAGDRIWCVGGVTFLPPEQAAPYLPPAPNSDFGWGMDAYDDLWSQQIGVFLRDHASGGQVIRVQTEGPVNNLEHVGLLVIDGWHD